MSGVITQICGMMHRTSKYITSTGLEFVEKISVTFSWVIFSQVLIVSPRSCAPTDCPQGTGVVWLGELC